MKKIMGFICMVLLLAVSAVTLHAQTTTIILLRHAEKDTTVAGSAMMKADPSLTKAGEQRAERLLEVLKAYQPDVIYATNYARTKATIMPLARKFNKEIQVYDPKNLPAFAEQLIQQQGKTLVVAGHSNTTPSLVNLLIKENKYANLDDGEYGQFWIVNITNGKAVAKLMNY